MEGKGDGANPPHQPTPDFHQFKRKSPSDTDSKISQPRVEVAGQDASKSIDGPTRLKHKLAKDAEQLKQLKTSCSENQNPNQERFLDKMLASYEEAIAILNKFASKEQDEGQGDLVSSWPRPPDDSDKSSMAASACLIPSQKISKVKPNYKRKRSTVTWTEVCKSQNGGAPDDGYAWRKYGQKEILGSQHPRMYYRCVHKYVEGCRATKHVQRSDKDPTIFKIVYSGRHACQKSRVHASYTSQELSGTSNTCCKAPVEEVTDVSEIPDLASPLLE